MYILVFLFTITSIVRLLFVFLLASVVARPPPPIQPKPKKPAQEAPSPVAALNASPALSYVSMSK